MKNQDEEKKGLGKMVWIPVTLVPVCCVGILLIGGTGALGVAAILSWISSPLTQIGAAGILGAGLLALWGRRTRRNTAESRTIPKAKVETQLE